MTIRNPISKTELEKYKKEVRTLKKGFDLLRDHVVITDRHGNILYANKAVEQNTGFSVSEVIGKNPGDLWGGNMPKDFYEEMWNTIKVKRQPFVGQVRNKRKDGSEYWQGLCISPVIDKGGKIKFFIGIEPNITDLKAKEEFKKKFVSDIGQQLLQPVQAINWVLAWLHVNTSLTEGQQKSLQEIYQHNESLIDLIDDLLALSYRKTKRPPKKRLK